MSEWTLRDRDLLVKIATILGRPYHVSESVNGDISVFHVYTPTHSRHLHFQSPCESNPHGRVFSTIIIQDSHMIEWFVGGIREYCNFLDIGKDELLAVISK